MSNPLSSSILSSSILSSSSLSGKSSSRCSVSPFASSTSSSSLSFGDTSDLEVPQLKENERETSPLFNGKIQNESFLSSLLSGNSKLTYFRSIQSVSEEVLAATQSLFNDLTVVEIQKALEKGADINARKDYFIMVAGKKEKVSLTPLMKTCVFDVFEKEKIDFLISIPGMDVNATTFRNKTALMLAVDGFGGEAKPYNMFVQQGYALTLLKHPAIDVNAQDHMNKTALMMVMSRVEHPDFEELVQKLLAKGANISLTDCWGRDASWYKKWSEGGNRPQRKAPKMHYRAITQSSECSPEQELDSGVKCPKIIGHQMSISASLV